MENAKKVYKNLYMAWIDYKKAFDSVPHSWIIKCMKTYKVSNNIIKFMQNSMKEWQTDLKLHHIKGTIEVPNVKIRRGIFQGDSLSPLLFVLSIDPLSRILNKLETGYNMRKRNQDDQFTINHQLYMDDLKLYNSREKEMKNQLKKVKEFSDDIRMEFGIDKCKKITILHGKQQPMPDFNIDQDTIIKELDKEEHYKYLGILEASGIDHKLMRKTIKKEYIYRLRKIVKTNLTPKNKITAINQLATPVIQYSFGVVNWPQYSLDEIDRKTRKLLTMNKLFYKQQSHARLYLPRAEGGMGLIEINTSHRATTISTYKYLTTATDNNLKEVLNHEKTKPQTTSTVELGQNFLRQENIEEDDLVQKEDRTPTQLAKKSRRKYIKTINKKLHEEKKQDKRAGPIKKVLDSEYVDKEGSVKWLREGLLRYDGERIILRAQDQGLTTRATLHLQDKNKDPSCRFCKKTQESPSHLLSCCDTLLKQGEYTTHHNKVCNLIHWNILGEKNIERCDKYWKHQPEKGILSKNDWDIY